MSNEEKRTLKAMEREREQEYLAFIEENKRVIYKVCYLYAADEEEMKDLRQEVLINLWKGYPQFKGTAQLSTWIYRVSLNTCITFCKKLRNKEESLPIESLLVGDVIDDNSKTEHLREMYRLIYQLNRMEKAIILMWLDERSYEEIAEVCGMPRNTIATKLRRIKEKLTKLANE